MTGWLMHLLMDWLTDIDTLTKSSKDAWGQSRIIAIIVAHIITLITSLKIKQEKAQYI